MQDRLGAAGPDRLSTMGQVLLGCERMKVDAKGRVAIPARFLKALCAKNSGPKEPFGMIISPERSIRIMPYALYLEEVEYWSGLDDRIEDDRLIKNMVLSTADEGVLDAQNRIRLNSETMGLCGIGINRQVAIVGSMQYLQIYDPELRREMFDKGIPKLSRAIQAVAKKDDPKLPQVIKQYVINTSEIEARQENPPERE